MGELNRLTSIACLTGDFKIRLIDKQRAQALTDDRMVINQQKGYFFHRVIVISLL